MQKDCCSQTGLRKWFCPTPVNFVAGLIFFLAGLTKVMAGGKAAGFMGGAAISLVGLDPTTLGDFPMILGWAAIIVELVGGLIFMIGFKKASGFSALALTVVSGVILGTEIKKALGDTKSALEVFQATQFTILFFTVFAARACKYVMHCCGVGSCGTSCCTPEVKK